jgi:hypothetical protein
MPKPAKTGKDLLIGYVVNSMGSSNLRRIGSSGLLLRNQQAGGSTPPAGSSKLKGLAILADLILFLASSMASIIEGAMHLKKYNSRTAFTNAQRPYHQIDKAKDIPKN